MTVYAQQTKAYGQWRVVVLAADGTEHEGWGLTRNAAEYRARVKANETQQPGQQEGRRQW